MKWLVLILILAAFLATAYEDYVVGQSIEVAVTFYNASSSSLDAVTTQACNLSIYRIDNQTQELNQSPMTPNPPTAMHNYTWTPGTDGAYGLDVSCWYSSELAAYYQQVEVRNSSTIDSTYDLTVEVNVTTHQTLTETNKSRDSANQSSYGINATSTRFDSIDSALSTLQTTANSILAAVYDAITGTVLDVANQTSYDVNRTFDVANETGYTLNNSNDYTDALVQIGVNVNQTSGDVNESADLLVEVYGQVNASRDNASDANESSYWTWYWTPYIRDWTNETNTTAWWIERRIA